MRGGERKAAWEKQGNEFTSAKSPLASSQGELEGPQPPSNYAKHLSPPLP